ncbi:collagen alpha-1(XII) chain-like [Saccostrea cucullata]|uniref:collagen alpha-1(XII) chain-like n=1 Tax=Saccostrea cuccullata TaxID=36930 RepID=UPI002ED692A6
MLDFCKDFLKEFDIDSGTVRVGILSYSTIVHDHFFLNSYNTSTGMFNAIDTISWIFGSTNTADAIRDMREKYFSFANGDRWDARNIAVILTDGVSNINANRLQDEARQARNEGIHIYAIGIGLSDVTELNQIASVPASENTFIVNNFDELKDLDERIIRSLCPVSSPMPTRTTTTTTTRKHNTAKPRTTTKTLTTPTTTVLETEYHYFPFTTTITTTTSPPRGSGYDVVIMMDSSVPEKTFDAMKKYAKSLVNRFDIDNKEYAVGLMRYGESNDMQWNLNNYTSKKEIISAVDRVGHKRGTSSDAASAIHMVRLRMFNKRNGDRAFARNLIFLMTANERSDDMYATWNEAEEAEKENINLYTVGFDLDDTTEIDETSTHPPYIYRHLINTEEGDDAIDNSTAEIVYLMDEDVLPSRTRPKPTTTITTMMSTSTKIQKKLPRNTGTALMAVVSTFLVLSGLVFGVAVFLFHRTLKQQSVDRNQLLEKHALNELGETNHTADLRVEVPSENNKDGLHSNNK